MTNLYNLTEDSMRHVLSYLDMRDILTLRKVSWNVQYTIDEINPNFKIRSVSIKHAHDAKRIVLTIHTDRILTDKMITYKEGRNNAYLLGCYVSKEQSNGGVFVKKGDYMDIFTKDLEIILSNRKSVLEKLIIKLDSDGEMLDKLIRAISSALEWNTQQLKVKELEMYVTNQAQLFEVFRCIDPEKLEFIKLPKSSRLFESTSLEINGASELEQWEHAERLEMESISIPDIQQNLTHFKRFDVKVNKLTPDDLLFLKEKLKKSPNFEQASILFAFFDDQERLPELFPGFEWPRGTKKNCIFQFSETNRYLVFEFAKFGPLLLIKNLEESGLTEWIREGAHFIKE